MKPRCKANANTDCMPGICAHLFADAEKCMSVFMSDLKLLLGPFHIVGIAATRTQINIFSVDFHVAVDY